MKYFKQLLMLLFMLLCNALQPAQAEAETEEKVTICGWFDNPTPNNAWIHDRNGEWVIGIQGGHQAKGKWPRFSENNWIRTGHGSSGYGCACLLASVDQYSMSINHIWRAKSQSLEKCREDSKIKDGEPENPLK